MNATLTRHTSIALVLLVAVGLPRAGSAQYRLPTIVSADKADSLHDSAVQFAQTGRWHEAARLYRRSAEFRGRGSHRAPVSDGGGGGGLRRR
ncbi:MAG: hypothetical protein ACJ8CN_14045 [Gemmatimonadales bacterium]